MYALLCKELVARKAYPTKKENKSLYTWVSLQRVARKNKIMPARNIAALDKIHFIWDKQEAQWQNHYTQLKKYRSENPNQWPSQRSTRASDRALAVWMLYNRREINKGTILSARLKLLQKIRFPVDPTEEKWQQNFALAAKFIARHKRFPSRSAGSKPEQKLHAWLRYQVVKMNFGSLPKNRKKALNELNIKKFADILRDEELALSGD